MSKLSKSVFVRCLRAVIGVGALVFIPAWTVHYWQGWIFVGTLGLSFLGLSLFLKRWNPELLESRMRSRARSEVRGRQRVLHFLMAKGLLAAVGFSAVDHRFGWSVVPGWAVALGDVLVVAGFGVVLCAFKENRFAMATVEVQNRQVTVSTGVYGVVRHPMYAGWLLTFAGIPMALGSWWGAVSVVLVGVVTVLRLLDEEALLEQSLAGYSEYAKRVRFRLVPFVW